MVSRGLARVGMVIGITGLGIFITSVVATSPASNYEVSIYNAYHPITWVAFAVAFSCFLGLILSCYYRIRAVLGIAILYFLLLCLPIVRGYVLFATPRSDVLHHLSIIADVISTGGLPEYFYPSTHILFSVLGLITRLPITTLQSVGAVIFTTMLICGITISSRRLLGPMAGPSALIAAIPLVYTTYHISFSPWFFGLTLIPWLLLFILWRNKYYQIRVKIMALLVGLAIIPYHVQAAVFAIIVIVIASVIQWQGFRQQFQRKSNIIHYIVSIALIIWILNSDRINIYLIRYTTDQLAPGGGVSYAEQAGETSYTLWQLLWEFVILQWGTTFIYISLAGIIATIIIWRLWYHRTGLIEITIVLAFVAGILFGLILAIEQIFARDPIRIFQFALLFAIYLIGIGFWWGWKHDSSSRSVDLPEKGRSTVTVGLFACILLVGLLGGGTLYPDNRHLTHTTVEGTAWHLDHHDRTQPTYSQGMAQNMEQLHSGYTKGRQGNRAFSRHDPDLQLPDRLGYTNHSTISEWADKGYLLTKREDIKRSASHPDNRMDDIIHYTPSDKERLYIDNSVNQIYTNGRYQVWKIEYNK